MNFEEIIFDNSEMEKTNFKRFTGENQDAFHEQMQGVLEAWREYLREYAEKTSTLFGFAEYPWWKFDEPTWVSSLAIAIAKKYPDSILAEELPVKKPLSSNHAEDKHKGKKTDLGNADLWCCINPSAKESDRFSFYMEAKFSSTSRRNLDKCETVQLEDIQGKITIGPSSLLSAAFRDYQKSAGKKGTDQNITATSPHKNEKKRKHSHFYLALIIKPLRFDSDQEWPEAIKYLEYFDKKVHIHAQYGNSENVKNRNIYNYPTKGIVMREKESGFGFVALVLMLGKA